MSYTNSGIKPWEPFEVRRVHSAANQAMGGGGVAERVNLATGNHILSSTDLMLPYFDMPLTFKRIYNSRLDESGMFGVGWRSNLDMKIIEDVDDRLFIDETGAEWRFTWNGLGYDRPAGLFASLVKNAGGDYTLTMTHTQIILSFDSSGNLTTIQNPVGVLIEMLPATSGVKASLLGADDTREIAFTFSGSLLVEAKDEGSGDTVKYEYDASNRLEQVTFPDSSTISFSYDGATTILTQIIDRVGKNVNFSYEAAAPNRFLSRNAQDNTSFSVAYNAGGSDVTDEDGKTWSYTITGGLKTGLTTPKGKSYSWTYNADYQVLTQVIPGPITAVTNTYTANGQLNTKTDALSKTTTYNWNLVTNLLTSILDASSKTVSFTYNAARQIETITDQESNVTTYTWATPGILSMVTNPKGYKTEYQYNGFGMITQITDALGGTIKKTYDTASMKVISVTGKDGKITKYSWDTSGRLIKKDFEDGSCLEYSYEDAESISTVRKDSSGNIVDSMRKSYTATGLLSYEKVFDGSLTKYIYTKTGAIAGVVSDDSVMRDYSYDDDGNLTSVVFDNAPGQTYTFDVDDRGWRTKITYPNSFTVDYTRNDRGQVTELSLKDSTPTEVHRIEYTYDNLTQVSNVEEYDVTNLKSYNKALTRDDTGKITREYRTSQNLWGIDYDNRFTLDAIGNILEIEDKIGGENLEMFYDALNRLTGAVDVVALTKTVFSYNSSGRLMAIDDGGSMTKYSYDQYNNLTGIDNGLTPATMDFDLSGRLRKLDTASRESRFGFDAGKMLFDRDALQKEDGIYRWCCGNLLSYTKPPAGAAAAITYYLVTDPEGSVKVIMDGVSVINRIEYDTLGNIKNKTSAGNPEVDHLFRGNLRNFELDVDIAIAGIFDPRYGRFVDGSNDEGEYLIDEQKSAIVHALSFGSDLTASEDSMSLILADSGGAYCETFRVTEFDEEVTKRCCKWPGDRRWCCVYSDGGVRWERTPSTQSRTDWQKLLWQLGMSELN